MAEKGIFDSVKTLIILGILLIGIGVFMTFNHIRLHFTGVETRGTVANINISIDEDDGSKAYQPTFIYDCGIIKNITSKTQYYSSQYDYTIGEQVKLLCDPHHPTRLTVMEWHSFFPLIFTILGIGILIAAYKVWKEKKRIENLITNGSTLQAQIVRIITVEKDGKRTGKDYVIATHGKRVFESDHFPSIIGALLKPGDEVRVYIDPLDHKNYWVDIDQLQEDLNQKISTPQISTVGSQIPPQSS